MPNAQGWWTGQLEEIAREARRYLATRFPSLRAIHEDLVAESLLNLSERLIERSSQYPAAWFASGEPEREQDRAYLHRLAHTILRRRVADRFRGRAAAWAREASIDELPEAELGSARGDYERRLMAARMLKVCVEVLATLPEEDRELAATIGEARVGEGPRSAADRQRLTRLRRKLGNAIRERLGESVAKLLKEES
jgi:DNA-directed RNA polymerase specialized sigma24 family protein